MTGTVCSVAACKSNALKARQSGEKLSFFIFPKNKKRSKEWIRRCRKQNNFNPANKRVCSKHFTTEDFEDSIQARITHTTPKKLKETAVPSLNLSLNDDSLVTTSRSRRLQEKQIKPLVKTLSVSSENLQANDFPSTSKHDPEQTLEETFENVLKKNEKLDKQIEKLHKQIEEKDKIIAQLLESNSKLQNIVQDYENRFNKSY